MPGFAKVASQVTLTGAVRQGNKRESGVRRESAADSQLQRGVEMGSHVERGNLSKVFGGGFWSGLFLAEIREVRAYLCANRNDPVERGNLTVSGGGGMGSELAGGQ